MYGTFFYKKSLELDKQTTTQNLKQSYTHIYNNNNKKVMNCSSLLFIFVEIIYNE